MRNEDNTGRIKEIFDVIDKRLVEKITGVMKALLWGNE